MSKIIKVIYNYYNRHGTFLGERVYIVKDKQDLDRVMRIIEENPERYELVNVTEQIINA